MVASHITMWANLLVHVWNCECVKLTPLWLFVLTERSDDAPFRTHLFARSLSMNQWILFAEHRRLSVSHWQHPIIDLACRVDSFLCSENWTPWTMLPFEFNISRRIVNFDSLTVYSVHYVQNIRANTKTYFSTEWRSVTGTKTFCREWVRAEPVIIHTPVRRWWSARARAQHRRKQMTSIWDTTASHSLRTQCHHFRLRSVFIPIG